MTMKDLLPVLLLLAVSCKDKENILPPGAKTKQATTQSPAPVVTLPSLKDSLRGVWTNETSENGIFDITDSTFYYGDNFEDYRYELAGKNITIHYPDHDYEATVSFHGDTLVMKSKDGVISRYWRFKH